MTAYSKGRPFIMFTAVVRLQHNTGVERARRWQLVVAVLIGLLGRGYLQLLTGAQGPFFQLTAKGRLPQVRRVVSLKTGGVCWDKHVRKPRKCRLW